MRITRHGLLFVLVATALLIVPLLYFLAIQGPDANETTGNGNGENRTDDGDWPGLEYHGYYQVFDLFMSEVFKDKLGGDPERNWSTNSAHIQNAALQSNIIIVPHVVLDPQAYFYDPSYVDACIDNGLRIVLLVHTLAKYVYFLDPRPCTEEERKELLLHELRAVEEAFRRYKDKIVAVYIYDEPWVVPHNVTHRMLFDMAEAARMVFWNKPVIVMFHRQGNAYSFKRSDGTVVTYDEWAGRMPEAFDIVGVDPYFHPHHDDEPPDFRSTGDQEMVETDVAWASKFGKPIMLVGQAFDPGEALFFDRDNKDPRLSMREGFEDGVLGENWIMEGDVVTDSMSFRGNKSLMLGDGSNISSAILRFEKVHDIRVSFSFAVDLNLPYVWFALGNGETEPVRLGIQGRDLVFNDGARVELINKSIDVSPSVWHTITMEANVDANRWKIWFDGDRQSRLPNAVIPSSFSQLTITKLDKSTRVWLDEIQVEKDWSLILPNENETMLYYDVAKRYPQVNMLLWWVYPHSFASSLLNVPNDYQVTDVWAVQRRIWEMMID